MSTIRTNRFSSRLIVLTLAGILSSVSMMQGRELWLSKDERIALRSGTTLKTTLLGSYARNDSGLTSDRTAAIAAGRLRLELGLHVGTQANAEMAYEHRGRWFTRSAASAGAAMPLPADSPSPYRRFPLAWRLTDPDADTVTWHHEIDRLLLALHPRWGEVTIGRQAIGMGRGVLFNAIDLFAPFSPSDIDREWRPGVDALRIETRLTDTTSMEIIAVAGDRWKTSALIGRLRGYAGGTDLDLIAGKRGDDWVAGGSLSTVVANAAVHAEVALFQTPKSGNTGAIPHSDRWLAQLVTGASYTFNAGNGITVIAEYHYSEFGTHDHADGNTRLADSNYQARLLRGDTQILGRHAVGMQLSYPLDDSRTLAATVLQSPRDGSGLLIPRLAWNVNDTLTLVAAAYLPWGRDARDGRLRSEYGATPLSLYLQLSAYY